MRRTTSILAIAVLTVTAGCIGGLGGGDDGQVQGPPPIDHVPGGVDAVAAYEGSIASDPATESVVNALLQQSVPEGSDQPRTVDGLIAEFRNQTEAQTNLSLTSISGVVTFSEFPSVDTMTMGSQPEVYSGALVKAGWTEEELAGEVRDLLPSGSGASLNESTYGGTTVYVLEGVTDAAGIATAGPTFAFAKYEGNLWAMGTEAVVRDVIDVANGNADAWGGQLRDVYESTRSDAYVRAAVGIPEEYRTLLQRAAQGGMGPGPGMGGDTSDLPLANVTHLSMSYYTEGGQDGTIGTSFGVRFDDAEVAQSTKEQAEGLVSFAKGQVENETIETQLDAISFSTEGSTMSMTYESSVADIETLIEQFGGGMGGVPLDGATGSAGMGSATDVPQVAIGYDWDSSSGRLTAVHESGERLDGANLRAVCDATPVDTASGAVSAGETILDTAECSAGDTVRILWESPEGTTTQVISRYEVPGSAVLRPTAPV